MESFGKARVRKLNITKTCDCYLPLAIEINKILCYPKRPHPHTYTHLVRILHRYLRKRLQHLHDFRLQNATHQITFICHFLTTGNDSSCSQYLIPFTGKCWWKSNNVSSLPYTYRYITGSGSGGFSRILLFRLI